MLNSQIKEGNNKEAASGKGSISPPSISLPKGGGAIRGIGEKFSANPVTGTGSLSVPIFTTPSRSDFYPKLSLSYDSGGGNSSFGLGWDLSIPSITRKTEKGLPKYQDAEDSDTFILSGAEDLVPSLIQKDGSWIKEPIESTDAKFKIERYRPRIEGLFARIERWTNKETGDTHWQSISKDNITSVYGKTENARIFDPEDHSHVFKWLLEESYDDKGNVILYEYKQENADNVKPFWPQEKNRLANGADFANRYLRYVKYGNKTPFQRGDWLFEVVFDYGEHDPDKPEIGNEVNKWPVRPDAFSSYKATFEIRTYRLCQRVLMFHHFSELGNSPCLVRSTDFNYNDKDTTQGPVACYLTSATQTGYIRESGTENYQKKSFPSLDFAYNKRTINEEIRVSDTDSMENLPIGLDGAQYQWVDLDGEGISGILTEQADAWFYKRNLGNAEFGPVQAMPSPPLPPLPNPGNVRFTPVQVVSRKPSVANLQGGQQQFMDLAGDGQLDLVQFSGPLPGYYERNDDGEWENFTPFVSSPNIAWNDPNLRFIDLNGDGHTDILVSEHEVFVWYPSRAEEGFGPAEVVRKSFDEEKGPALVFADTTQSVYPADMSGDGLTDIVRIRNGEVCYWPNLGYGCFGAKVTMDAAPHFDHPEHFNPDRIRLADIDGSGTTDIIYLGRDTITFWFNQAGNSWSELHRLSNFPPTDNLSSVTVIDLLGNGTACIVWSSPLPSANGHPMQYIDLMGGIKPHLLRSTKNNMGAETRVQYASSTKFYLEDLYAGKPWITKLPFPVHVVERVEAYDYVGKTKLVTLSKYHHGYYDGIEREFRGFGMVEQWDTEFLEAFKGSGLFDGETGNSDESLHLPPVYTKTWFHTGVYIDRDHISNFFADKEYYREPQATNVEFQATLLPDTVLPTGLTLPDGTVLPSGLTVEEEYEACRALKGQILRQEIYALDDSPKSKHPYSVSERNYELKWLQPKQDGQYAVFFAHPRETVDYHYERNPGDPRISHAMTLEVDLYGNVTRSAAITYPRRANSERKPEQEKTLIIYTENRVTNKPNQPDWYRIGVPIEARTYEITGILLQEKVPYLFDAVRNATQTTTEIQYEGSANLITPQKRLIERVRTLYLKNDLSGPLPLGGVESLALPYESYKLAFTPGLLKSIFVDSGKITGSDLANALKDEGGYKELDANGYWWIPSGQVICSPVPDNPPSPFVQNQVYARQHFYLPQAFQDPFRYYTRIEYDRYDLLLKETKDPLGNVVTVVTKDDQGNNLIALNYRVMQPWLVTDPNGNRSAVRFDALGMVVTMIIMGKAGQNEGDKLDEMTSEVSPNDDPTTRLEYELFDWVNNERPNFVHTFAREQHGPANPRWQEFYSYSDGFGREIQKKIQAEPGPLVEGGPTITPRWVGTGWTIFNNKGKPVKKYEPFFSDTHEFEFAKQVGVSSTLFYDPLERVVATLHPNHTYEKVVFDPWRQETWDVNDTLHPSQRYDPQSPLVLPDHTFNPVDDPDVGKYLRRLPEDEYWPTWYNLRMDATKALQQWPDTDSQGRNLPQNAKIRAAEKSAAQKAAKHAATPSITHLDTLGRPFLTIADNGTADKYETHVELDIEGNQRSTSDAIRRDQLKQMPPPASIRPTVMMYQYDMLGTQLHSKSMDAGERWVLNDVAGKPIFAWDQRGHTLETKYDQLRRPIELYLSGGRDIPAGRRVLAEKTIYGESQGDANNHRGKVYQHYDGAGVVTNVKYDFKGNLKETSRKLVKEYKNQIDWNQPPADDETFTAATEFDALNRPIVLTTPHNANIVASEVRPIYNEANLLNEMRVKVRGAMETAYVKNINYDAKGQRELIEYGNGASTTYEYDPDTFRLTHLRTNRQSDNAKLQDLFYTYDPVGNITYIKDDAQQTVYFNNTVVPPENVYTYDAIYRLLEASGREHIGQTANNRPEHRPELKPHYDFNDSTRMGLAHPNDGQAMRQYTELYEYDAVGNFRTMTHKLGTLPNPGQTQWARRYDYEPASNRLRSTSIPADPSVGPLPVRYEYDAHGNMTKMPHLTLMRWNFKDQLSATSLQVTNTGTPETTYYVYESGGQRVRKVTEAQNGAPRNERLYLGGFEIYREYNGGGVKLERETLHIMDDKQRIALVETRTDTPALQQLTRYQFGNHLGSASLELDDAGAVISYEEYYSYGGTSYQAGRSAAEVSLKRYRYTGKERDEETGLYYHGARYYASWLGRWVNCDPAGMVDGLNVYSYVSNSPTIHIDPSGTQSEGSILPYDQQPSPHPGLVAEHGIPWKAQFWILAGRFGQGFAEDEERTAYSSQVTMLVGEPLADMKTSSDISMISVLRAAVNQGQGQAIDIARQLRFFRENFQYSAEVTNAAVTNAQIDKALTLQGRQFFGSLLRGDAYRRLEALTRTPLLTAALQSMQQGMEENLSLTGQLRALGAGLGSSLSSLGKATYRAASSALIPGLDELRSVAGGGSALAGAHYLLTTHLPYYAGVAARTVVQSAGLAAQTVRSAAGVVSAFAAKAATVLTTEVAAGAAATAAVTGLAIAAAAGAVGWAVEDTRRALRGEKTMTDVATETYSKKGFVGTMQALWWQIAN